MATSYPTALPAVPDDRWNAERTGDPTYTEDPGMAIAYYAIDAASAIEAERRLLAWIDRDYEDDLRDATATAQAAIADGRWSVELRIPGEF